MLGTKAAAQKPTRSITDNAKLQGLEKTCDEARATKPQPRRQRIGCRLTLADSMCEKNPGAIMEHWEPM